MEMNVLEHIKYIILFEFLENGTYGNWKCFLALSDWNFWLGPFDSLPKILLSHLGRWDGKNPFCGEAKGCNKRTHHPHSTQHAPFSYLNFNYELLAK